MKKMKLFSLLLALTMVLSLAAGCQGKAESTQDSASAAPQESGVSAAAPEETPEPAEASVEASMEETSAAEETALPEIGPYEANEEHTEITVLFQYAAFFQGFFPEGWISSDWWKVMGEKTNATFTLREISNLEWSENVNLLCASGDLPDLVTNGLWIRQDWLDELGKEIPTTTDELKTVLELFRDNFGADVGFFQMIRANTGEAAFAAEGIWNAFGPTGFYLDDQGTIQYAPMQEHYYDYIGYCKELASEGLFLTSDMTDQKANNLFASGSIGLEGDSPDNIPSYLALLNPEEAAKAKLVPMRALGEATEYSPIATYVSGDAGGNVSISTNCENPEAVLHVLDYLFTDEGAVFSSYGIEGESYELNSEGKPEFTDLVSANPDGIPVRAALGYFCNPGLPGYIDYARNQSSWDDVQKSAFDVWNSAYTGSSKTVDVNALTLTQEEQDAVAVHKSDMITYVTEWVNGVVFGETPLDDASIAEFQATMKDTMHIDDILATYNTAYERFQERSLDQ